ncbi:MAG TPA: 2-amino-4-hydroxy-6-hydroxymethyldihydropteridine diphosphokinase [Acidimicrobiales bacterium]|nr:2-amino-4-hydroxy-6-hydroxymethyldihydropteridine diphosphokinase [Acidimicrobiales bacterium]
MTRGILGFGSNLGDRWETLARAMGALGSIVPDLVVSSVFESAPVGGPEAQGPYLNCVAVFSWAGTPGELLNLCHRLEQEAGRVRRERWGARTLDVDVLVIDGYSSADPELTVPHPRMFDRAFVLMPLEEVAPDAVDVGWRSRLGTIETGERAIRCVGVLLSPVKE